MMMWLGMDRGSLAELLARLVRPQGEHGRTDRDTARAVSASADPDRGVSPAIPGRGRQHRTDRDTGAEMRADGPSRTALSAALQGEPGPHA